MKRDMDLVRSLLVAIEDEPQKPDSEIFIQDKKEEESEIIIAHLELLHDAGYIKCITSRPVSGSWYCRDISLTWDGHEFVDTLRDSERWEQAKGIATKAGGVGLKAMVEIGKAIAKGELQKLGFPIA